MCATPMNCPICNKVIDGNSYTNHGMCQHTIGGRCIQYMDWYGLPWFEYPRFATHVYNELGSQCMVLDGFVALDKGKIERLLVLV
jgi:hypothetical protein